MSLIDFWTTLVRTIQLIYKMVVHLDVVYSFASQLKWLPRSHPETSMGFPLLFVSPSLQCLSSPKCPSTVCLLRSASSITGSRPANPEVALVLVPPPRQLTPSVQWAGGRCFLPVSRSPPLSCFLALLTCSDREEQDTLKLHTSSRSCLF